VAAGRIGRAGPYHAGVIEASHLTKRFRQLGGYRDLALYPWRRRSHLAVDDISLEIGEGELFGLLGENGAGKTTLIRMLTTTLVPTSGSARVGGFDVVRDPHPVRRLIGLVSGDERTFYWRLTGRQNLEFFASLYHVARRTSTRRIADLLDSLDVADYADERFDTYSTGIRQKFAIARGLLTEPRVLFLDEPTRALDPIAADETRRYINDHIVSRLGTTVLMATHTLSEAESMCRRIAIIRHGRMFAAGSMDELRSRMALRDVFELVVVGQSAGLRDTISAVTGLEHVHAVTEGEHTRVQVHMNGRQGTLNDLLRAVLETGVQVQSSTMRRPTLDDIYRAAHADA
jgi:ABC-2 type transport system ATP-binding protein